MVTFWVYEIYKGESYVFPYDVYEYTTEGKNLYAHVTSFRRHHKWKRFNVIETPP